VARRRKASSLGDAGPINKSSGAAYSRVPLGRRAGLGALFGSHGWPLWTFALPSGVPQFGAAPPGLVGCSPDGWSRVCAPATDPAAQITPAARITRTCLMLHLLLGTLNDNCPCPSAVPAWVSEVNCTVMEKTAAALEAQMAAATAPAFGGGPKKTAKRATGVYRGSLTPADRTADRWERLLVRPFSCHRRSNRSGSSADQGLEAPGRLF
jgi:hypothetical protein